MGFYQFKKEIVLKTDLDTLWDFISRPANLKLITPDYMGFDITTESTPDKIYEGLIISYKVAPIMGIKTTWVTEITHVRDKSYFVDEQRLGPYKMWHHQHFLKEIDGGILMTDIVSYKPPMGIFGSLANYLIINNKLQEIFDYRTRAVKDIFGVADI